MRHPRLLLCLIAALCTTVVLRAQYERCRAAPEARPKLMLQGETVGAFKQDKVYIIALWARWPGNQEMVLADQYRENIAVAPGLAKLEEAFVKKGLVVLTVAFGEKDPAEALKVVEKYKTAGVAVRVGFDADRAMANAWLDGDVNRRTPHAFAIARGRIIWEGHPARLTPGLVASFVDGTFSPEKAAQLQARQEAVEEAVAEGRLQQAEALLEEALPLMPEGERDDYANMVRAAIAARRGDNTQVRRQMLAFAEESKDDLVSQNEQANLIMKLVERSGDTSYLEIASSCAERAVKLAADQLAAAPRSGGSGLACCLDTLARVRFMQGRRNEAIKLQEQAIAQMQNEAARKVLRESLESYRRGQLPPMIEEPSEFSR